MTHMSEETNEPRFPDIPPERIVRSEFHVIEDDDISSADDLKHLLRLMYEHPERSYYCFSQQDRGMNPIVLGAQRTGLIKNRDSDH